MLEVREPDAGTFVVKLDRSDRAVSLFRDNDLRHALLLGVEMVVFVAVEEAEGDGNHGHSQGRDKESGRADLFIKIEAQRRGKNGL